MKRIELKNKPLVEAIFEIKWDLKEIEQKIKVDPHYKIVVGILYEKLQKEFPYHESLPIPFSPVSDDMLEGFVQHRFRKAENEWPLVQIGPGILTVNDTAGYIWEEYNKIILKVVKSFLNAYPNSEDLEINSLMLRYIDAIDFDFKKEDIFEFMKQKLKIDISLHSQLFDKTKINRLPVGFDWRFSFPCNKPKGIVNLRFTKGYNKKKNTESLIWETVVHSIKPDIKKLSSELGKWLTKAHGITDDWFFKLIEGELFRRFK